jgi:hypothetical protein
LLLLLLPGGVGGAGQPRLTNASPLRDPLLPVTNRECHCPLGFDEDLQRLHFHSGNLEMFG